MAKVLIPTPLRQYSEKQDSVELTGTTVGEVLSSLTAKFPDLKKQLFNDEGKLRSFVNVYLNDEDIRYLKKDATPVASGDTLSIVPSIAGGSGDPPVSLSNDEIMRYSRHLIMPEVGMEGQLRLKNASVLLVGTGGLGAPLGMYLAAAGVGRIGLVDFDVVDFTNLHRQIIHGTKDVGRKKLDSAADTISDINPNVKIEKYDTMLSSENALEICKNYDLIIDGTDNFPTRYLVNDACVLLKKPNVYGSIFRFEGQATVFAFPGGPCYRCLYPEPPPPGLVPSCAEGGVLGILPGIIGLIQATEAVKLILGVGETLVGRLVLYDALAMRFRELKLRRNPECPACGDHPTITKLIDYQEFCGIPHHEPPPAPGVKEGEIDPVEVKAKMDRGDQFLILDVREPHEYLICSIPTSKLIPLGDLPKRVNELDTATEIVAHCKSGVRSAKAVDFLKQAGFKKVKNMKGGILAWSDKVDPKVSEILSMKFGGFYEHQLPRPWTKESEHTLLKHALDEVELSDRSGFDYIWATEHHFLEEYAHSSAPEVFLAACSQRTKNVRIGHGIVQMPPYINHPARVAERIATLDLLSDGRVEYGIGAGASETELGGFNVPQAVKKDMMLEGARAVVEMLTQEPFPGIDGTYVKMPARNVVPKPLQKPHPPMWLACSNRPSILQAARLGLGALTFSFIDPGQARQWVADYYETFEKECVPLGYAVNPNIAIACPFLCDKNEARLGQIAAESYGFFIYALGHYSFFGEHEPAKTDIWDEFKNRPKEFALPEGRPLDGVGTPDQVRQRLRDFEDAGIDQVICLSQAANISHDMLSSSIELFSKEVLPEFKDRDQKSSRAKADRSARLTELCMPRRTKTEAPSAPTVIRAAGHH